MENKNRLETLQEYLRDGESVLWHGPSEPCRFLEGKDKTRIIRNWAITLVLFGGLFGLYLGSAAEKSATILVVFALVMAVILSSPYMEWRKLRNQYYWVTDQRVIACVAGDLFSVDMSLVDAVDVKELPTGNKCVLLGRKIVDEGDKQLRWRGGTPATGSKAGEVGLLFYNVIDAEGAVDAVRSVRAGV